MGKAAKPQNRDQFNELAAEKDRAAKKRAFDERQLALYQSGGIRHDHRKLSLGHLFLILVLMSAFMFAVSLLIASYIPETKHLVHDLMGLVL